MASLAELQRVFAEALRDPRRPALGLLGQSGSNGSNGSSRRLDVYRNNMTVGLVDALGAAFPTVQRLVGERYFRAVARAFLDAHPPRSPVLLYYGDGFADFLEDFPSASQVPYLGDVARLEWARLSALHAADAEPVSIEALAHIGETWLERVTFTPHPSLTLMRSRWPVVSLWSACRHPDAGAEVDMTQAQAAAILRPALSVAVHTLPAGTAAFAERLSQGTMLGTAAQQTAESDPAFDLAAGLQLIFQIGAVAAIEVRAPRDAS